jgi:hypothetical protein
MTEQQIENRVEGAMNNLDRVFMAGKVTQSEYDARVRELNAWAERQYRAMPIFVRG